MAGFELNIGSLFYLFFRLAPFFIVSYFTLSSVFNADFRGFVYLVGLVIACVICIIVGKVLPSPLASVTDTGVRMKCSALTLGKTEPLSNLPLSQTVFGFTLAYLSYFVATNNLTSQNVPMFVVMSLIIVADLYWNIANTCADMKYLGLALVIGGGFGAGWASFIEINAPSVAYYSGTSNHTCSQPSKGMYRCRPQKK
jgi:hypothetical protein